MDSQPTNAEEKMLIKAYYTDGHATGRDALYYYIKQQHPVNFITKHKINNFLKRQRVHQLFIIPKQPKQVTSFRRISPIHSFSIDLIDYSKKTVNGHNYVINMIDNFSRYIWTVPIRHKIPEEIIAAIKPILEDVQKKFNKLPKYILSDRGGEFGALYVAFLKSLGIRNHNTIAGMPQSNGTVERSNLSLKQIMTRQKQTQQTGHPNWFTLLEKVTKVYNNTFHTALKMTPSMAIEIKDEEVLKTMRSEQKKKRVEHKQQQPNYKVGDEVRLRKLKSSLSKYTEPNWTTELYKIEKVRPSTATTATKYVLEGMQNKKWLREHLQVVKGDELPPKEYAIKTRAKKKEEEAPRRSVRLNEKKASDEPRRSNRNK